MNNVCVTSHVFGEEVKVIKVWYFYALLAGKVSDGTKKCSGEGKSFCYTYGTTSVLCSAGNYSKLFSLLIYEMLLSNVLLNILANKKTLLNEKRVMHSSLGRWKLSLKE